mgnify:CR=1 FL=1
MPYPLGAQIISVCGRLPLLGAFLRRIADSYREGSVVTILAGHLAGSKWKRSHRHVNGYWLGIYELAVQRCLVRQLRPGNVFYDIGSNAGFFTLLGSQRVGPTGRVFAFEPESEHVPCIRSQLALNGIRNCTLVNAAVANVDGYVDLVIDGRTSRSHVRRRYERRDCRSVSVRAVRLDDFTRTSPAPDLIKLDIEGGEADALQGARRLLSSELPPKILIEFHGRELRRECLTVLSEFKYSFQSLDVSDHADVPCGRHVLCMPPGRSPS